MRFLVVFIAVVIAGITEPSVAQTPSSSYGADRHAAKGITCEMCHGTNREITIPSIEQCAKCHVPDVVSEKTKAVKPQNPHVSPHYGNKLDCALCHVQHEKTENYCAQCHDFKYKVP